MGIDPQRVNMVSALNRYLSKKRLIAVTRMAVPGYSQPRAVKGVVPDMEAVTLLTGQPVYGAVEKCETYASDAARARLTALSRIDSAAVFLVVPAACYQAAKQYVQSAFPDSEITVLPFGKEA